MWEVLSTLVGVVMTGVVVPALFVVARLISKVTHLEETIMNLPSVIANEVDKHLNRTYKSLTDRIEKTEERLTQVENHAAKNALGLHEVKSHLRIYSEEQT